MCAIAGVSFAPGSTINRHKIANALLTEGQVRGRDASGYAYVTPDGSNGLFKNDVPGSQLYVGGIPQEASSIILHTRASTHGSPRDMDNNHPVESPEGTIRLVHNGVIWNHSEVRTFFDKNTQKNLPDVDSSVIGAVIEAFGLDQTNVMEGDAAVAWFDSETDDTIHLARFQNSPVHYATLYDGSFVFASTASILAGALKKLGLMWIGSYPMPFESMDETDYFQVIAGEVINESTVEWGDEYSSRSQYNSKWRSVTSGATTTPAAGTAVTKTQVYGVPVGTPSASDVGYFGQDVDKANKVGPVGTPNISKPMALTDGKGELNATGKAVAASMLAKGSEDRTEYGEELSGYLSSPDKDDPDFPDVQDDDAPFRDTFFSYGHDGDYVTYTTLGGLLSSLSFNAKQGDTEDHLVGPDEGNLRWVNHFADVGHLSTDMTDELSWVRDQGAFEVYRQQTPFWVNDGVNKLRTLVGA